MGALAFVPGRYVRLAWQAGKADMPQLLRVEKFIICYLETWLEGPNHCSREKPRLMNCKRIPQYSYCYLCYGGLHLIEPMLFTESGFNIQASTQLPQFGTGLKPVSSAGVNEGYDLTSAKIV